SCMFPPSSPPMDSISQYSVSIQTWRRFCHAPRRPRGSVRFHPRTGHVRRRSRRPLCANSGHQMRKFGAPRRRDIALFMQACSAALVDCEGGRSQFLEVEVLLLFDRDRYEQDLSPLKLARGFIFFADGIPAVTSDAETIS